MSKEKELRSFSDGEYVFQETENANQFLFYRQNGQDLGEVGRIPMDMYQNYMCMRMFEGNLTEIVMSNVRFDKSVDGKAIRLTTFGVGEKDPIEAPKKSENIKIFVKSLFSKLKK